MTKLCRAIVVAVVLCPGCGDDAAGVGDHDGGPGRVDAGASGGLDGALTGFRNLTPPAWPSHVYLDTAGDITPPTYTSTPDVIHYDYYRNADPAPYRVANTVPIHTPRSSEGIVVGDSLRIVARAVLGGVEHPGVASASKIVEGAPMGVDAGTGADAGTSGGRCTGGTALAQLPFGEAGPALDGAPETSGTYDGVSAKIWSGNVILGPVLDPNGSGLTVNLHRIMEAAPPAWRTTHRSELLWGSTTLPPGVDTWQAFAVMRKPGEQYVTTTSNDAILVFQSHTPESGDTGPPYSLILDNRFDGMDTLRWRASYNEHPPSEWDYNGGPYPTRYDSPWLHDEPMLPEGIWYRYIVHYRAGYATSHAPILEVWRARPGAAYDLLFTYTGLNAYNGGDGYVRIGPYKWDANWYGQPSLAFYMTPLYYGRGTDLFAEAAAALCALDPGPPPAP